VTLRPWLGTAVRLAFEDDFMDARGDAVEEELREAIPSV
jgi:hypothetical protein